MEAIRAQRWNRQLLAQFADPRWAVLRLGMSAARENAGDFGVAGKRITFRNSFAKRSNVDCHSVRKDSGAQRAVRSLEHSPQRRCEAVNHTQTRVRERQSA